MNQARGMSHFRRIIQTRALRARGKAFTLVELLVVVLIITLLAGILLPSIRKSIRQARSTVCKSNLKDLYRSLDMYQIENNGWLPTGNPDDPSYSSELWPTLLFQNDPAGKGVLICPDDPWANVLRNNIQVARPGSASTTSYGMNDFILSSPKGFLANLARFSPKHPGNTLLLADMGPDYMIGSSAGSCQAYGIPSRNGARLGIDDGYRPGLPPSERRDPWLSGRHMKRINVLTITGNVKEVNIKPVLQRPVDSYYPACAAQYCTICVDLEVPHYSFAESQAFWWTGPAPIQR